MRILSAFCTSPLGSSNEPSYQLLLCRDLGFLDAESYEGLAADAIEIQRMIGALIQKAKADSPAIDTTR